MIDFPLAALFGGDPVTLDAAPKGRADPVRQSRKPKVLRPVVPSAAIQQAYQRRLLALVDEMAKSVRYWVEAAYRGNPPETMARDELSYAALRAAIQRLTRQWFKKFDDASDKLARYFTTKVADRNDAALRKILKDGGFSIDFKMTAAQRDAIGAIVHENVGLIKSIPREYLGQVEGMTMRSVAAGRDLKSLTDDLQKQFGVTRRRAELIARDQNNKATGALARVRQIEIGGDQAEAIWIHSGNTKSARPSHLKAGRERARFSVKAGWFDPDVGRNINPGELVNCRCFSRLLLKGFT